MKLLLLNFLFTAVVSAFLTDEGHWSNQTVLRLISFPVSVITSLYYIMPDGDFLHFGFSLQKVH